MAKKLTNKQKGYLAGAGALGLFLLYGGSAKAKELAPPPKPGPGPSPKPGPGPSPEPGPEPKEPETTVLKKGSSGAAVRDWQRLLCAFALQDLSETYGLANFADGKFGPATESATKLFQTEHNKNSSTTLVVDGIAGSKTQSSMFQYFESGQDPNGLSWAQAKSKSCGSHG